MSTTLVALVVATPTHRLASRLGSRGTRGSSAARSSGASWRRISACLIAARISRRSVVAGAGSTVTSTFVTALARVSSAVRSLTGIAKVTEPSAVTRPTRWASRAANPASSVLLVPPSAFARASHSSASTKIVAVGIVMGSSAPADGAGGGLAGHPARTAVTPGRIVPAATTARPMPGMSRAVWRASSRRACHRRRDPAAGQSMALS